MYNTSTQLHRWPALLLLGVAVFGPPSFAVLKFTQAVTKTPWLTAVLIVLYEVIMLLVSIPIGVWQQLKDSWAKRIAATPASVHRWPFVVGAKPLLSL